MRAIKTQRQKEGAILPLLQLLLIQLPLPQLPLPLLRLPLLRLPLLPFSLRQLSSAFFSISLIWCCIRWTDFIICQVPLVADLESIATTAASIHIFMNSLSAVDR